MKPSRLKLLLTALLFVFFQAQGQVNTDSLWGVWSNESLHDTLRLEALQIFSKEGYLKNQPDSAYHYANILYAYADKRGLKKYMAGALNIQGSSYFVRGDYNKALEYFQRCKKLLEAEGNVKARAALLNNMAAVSSRIGNVDESVALYKQSLALHNQIGDTTGMIATLNGLGVQHKNLGEYDLAIDFYRRSLELSRATDHATGAANALHNISSVYKDRGDFVGAIATVNEAIEFAMQTGDNKSKAQNLNLLGIIQQEQRNLSVAFRYFEESYHLRQSIGDEKGAATTLVNMGIVLKLQADSLRSINLKEGANMQYEKALEILERAVVICEEVGDMPSKAGALINVGSVYHELKQFEKALDAYFIALELSEKQGNKKALATVNNNIGLAYAKLGNIKQAEEFALKGLNLARVVGSIKDVMYAAQNLQEVYEKTGKSKLALEMHELYVQMYDSITGEENRREVIRQQFQFDYDKKQALLLEEHEKKDALAAEELQRKRFERNAVIGGFCLMMLLAMVFFGQRTRIAKEKKRSDELLLNILPSETAEELKATGSAKARHFDQVTVLFTDFKGFTELSEKVSPQKLVVMINECFSAFDNIMVKYGVEKIKTIGDAYMAVGGLPASNSTHPADVVMAALEIQEFIEQFAKRNNPSFEIRIGIHTGPVVAGIVGIKKFQYDIWGDTVSIASKIEKLSQIGRVHISQSTYELVKEKFECTYYNEMSFRKGDKINMYFVAAKA